MRLKISDLTSSWDIKRISSDAKTWISWDFIKWLYDENSRIKSIVLRYLETMAATRQQIWAVLLWESAWLPLYPTWIGVNRGWELWIHPLYYTFPKLSQLPQYLSRFYTAEGWLDFTQLSDQLEYHPTTYERLLRYLRRDPRTQDKNFVGRYGDILVPKIRKALSWYRIPSNSPIRKELDWLTNEEEIPNIIKAMEQSICNTLAIVKIFDVTKSREESDREYEISVHPISTDK